jgi:AcrR family transcriptional regulator
MSAPNFQSLVDEATGRRPAPAPEDDADGRILDAALGVVAEYGERRLTMDDVAQAAKVGRATVFRRFGSKDALLARLYAREVRRALAYAFAAVPEDGDAAQALGAASSALTDHVAGHPVIVRIARVEPDVLVELWRSGDPAGFDVIVGFLSAIAVGRNAPLDRSRLASTCDLLARLMFAELLLPAGRPRERAARRARVAALADDQLSAA